MKKFFSSIFVIAAAALAFSACQKQEAQVNVPGATTINFKAVSPDTKAVFGDAYKVSWTGTEEVKVTTHFNDATTADATVGTDGAFSATMDVNPPYRFYAAVPASAVYAVNEKYWDWNFTVPAEQTPGKNTPDEAAVILYAQSDSLETAPAEALELQFHHLLSYGVLNIKNLSLASGESVSSIAMAFEFNVAGGLYLYPKTDEISAHHSSKTITLNTSAVDNLWFSLIPQSDMSGSDVTVTVYTNNGTKYAKTATFPDDGVSFNAGSVNNINIDFTGVTAEGEYDFTTIAELNALASSSSQAGLKGNVKDVVVSYVNGSNAYLEDATGATLLYRSNHGLTQGQKINGPITVTLTTYHSCSELTALDTSEATVTTGATIPCTTKTLAELMADGALAKYQSMRIKVVDVNVTKGFSSSSRTGEMEQNGTTMAVYSGVNSGLTGVVTGANADFVGFIAYYNGNQLVVYTDDDITIHSSMTEGTISLDPSSLSLEVGKTGTITATTNSDATVVWTSSDETVATVNNGVVTAVAAGSARITASVAETSKFTAAEASASVVVKDPSATTVSDVLTVDLLNWAATSNGYQDWTYTGATASYSGQSYYSSDIQYIQLRSKNSNSGIVSTTSGGKLASVEIVFNATTTYGTSDTGTDLNRSVDVYGNNTAYSAPSDLYSASTQGTKIGSATYDGSTVKYVVTPDADYSYVGIRSYNGALYLDSVTFVWE